MEQFEKQGFFINKDGVKNTDLMLSKPKFHDNVVVPKHPRSPYIYFYKEQLEMIKKVDPTQPFKLLETAAKASEKWSLLTDADKTKYFKLSLEDKTRYQNEMQQLLTQGFFVNEAGQKSTDLKKGKTKSADDSKLNMSQSTKTGTTFGTEQALSQSSSVKSAKLGSKRSINVSSSSEKVQTKKLKK